MRLRMVTAMAVLAAVAGVPVPVGAAAAVGADGVGLFDARTSTWYVRGEGAGAVAFEFGSEGVVPLAGDWDGDGFDSPGVYDPASGVVHLVNQPGEVPTAAVMPPGGIPVAGDPDGDGRDTVAVVAGGVVAGSWAGTVPPEGVSAAVAADLDGDGRDELLLHTAEGWWSEGRAVTLPALGEGDRAVAGDWDGDGVDGLGVFRARNAEFWLYAGATAADGVSIVPMGSARMVPVAGRFGPLSGRPAEAPRVADLPPLQAGDAGPAVVRLQAALAARALYRGPLDGKYGPGTAEAVMAFHKAAGLERSWDWQEGDADALHGFEPSGFPDRPDEPDRVEVDLARQLMLVVVDHEVAAVMHVSTGGGYTYFSKRAGRQVSASTPRGDFALLRYSPGRSCDPLYGWCIYNAWNFTPVYAIHGYPSVPSYPASHGCVRVSNPDADVLESLFYVGMPVHVWSEMPVIPEPEPEPVPEPVPVPVPPIGPGGMS